MCAFQWLAVVEVNGGLLVDSIVFSLYVLVAIRRRGEMSWVPPPCSHHMWQQQHRFEFARILYTFFFKS